MNPLNTPRAQIDRIDDQIVDLMIERFKIVHAVAAIKARENMPVVQGPRVIEVKERVAARAQAGGLDGDLLRSIYTLIIDHAHTVEGVLVDEDKKK